MKVKATRLGYYGLERRYIGDVFEISDAKDETGKIKAFSEKWMEKVEEKTPVKSQKPGKPGIPIPQEATKPTPTPDTESSKEGQTPTGDSEVI